MSTIRRPHPQECKGPSRQCFCDLWPWPLPFDPKINGLPGIIVEHFKVKFGDPSSLYVYFMVRKNRQTQTPVKTVPPRLLSAWVINYMKQSVALTKRNITGPPSNVGCPPAGSVTDDDRRQRYWPIKPRPHQQQCRSNVRLCCQKRQQCQCCFGIVVGVDRTLSGLVKKFVGECRILIRAKLQRGTAHTAFL